MLGFAFHPLAVRHGELVHTRRVHSHPAGVGGDCRSDSANPRPKPSPLMKTCKRKVS